MSETAAISWSGTDWTLRIRWQRMFLFLQGFLASTIVLKIGPVQYLELIDFLLIVVLLLLFVAKGYRAVWYREALALGCGYVLFCVIAFLLSLAALRFTFYFPTLINPYKMPVTITLERSLELAASVAAMLYMAQLFARSVDKMRFTMKVYFGTGVASGIYSLVSLPLNLLLGTELFGAYSNLHRLRGFYNEGGPYGLYALSVIMVGLALYRLGWQAKRTYRWTLPLMSVVLLLSFSKAAYSALIMLFLVNALSARSSRQRAIIFGVGVTAFVALSVFVDVPAAYQAYRRTAAQYERLSHFHKGDENFVFGRVAGAFIVPRMIAAHPLTGVGWGNYGVLRNAPEYRGSAVFVSFADDPGLGMFGLAAELGLPLVAFLLLCLLFPYFFLRYLHAPVWLTNLALLQPLVHLFGAQLNVTYPWVVSGFALSLGLYLREHRGFPGANAAGLFSRNPNAAILEASAYDQPGTAGSARA